MGQAKLRFDGEVVLVAGGGGSLGGAYCQLFAERGARVIVNDIAQAAEQVAETIRVRGGEATAIVASSATEADSIVERTIDRYGRLDVVVNSSGLTNGGLFHEIPAAEWQAVFDSHFTSTLNLARAAWPHLVASGNGRLINSASTSIFGSEFTSTYIAAKSAIFGVGHCWAREGALQGVRVNTILPTAISQMTRNIPDPKLVALLEQQFQPEKVAGVVAFLAHRDTALNGVAIEAGGGRIAPVFLAEGESLMLPDMDDPDALVGHEAIFASREAKYTPESMMEELAVRLQDMGAAAQGSDTKADDVWGPETV